MQQQRQHMGTQFRFECVRDYPDRPRKATTMATDAVTFDGVMDAFEEFLKGSGLTVPETSEE